MSSAQGRFTGPDEPLADQHEGNPQSWNLFAYVRNNPLRYADPTGRTCQTSGKLTYDDLDGKGCSTVDEANRTKRPDITVNERRAGGGEAYDYLGSYIPGSYRPPSPQHTAIHDPVPGAILTFTSVAGDAQAAMFVGKVSRWGWAGTAKFTAAVRKLKEPGTHKNLEGIVPTLEEAKELIRLAGGRIERIEEGHAIGGVSEHTYPHINYTTQSNAKATVKVNSVR